MPSVSCHRCGTRDRAARRSPTGSKANGGRVSGNRSRVAECISRQPQVGSGVAMNVTDDHRFDTGSVRWSRNPAGSGSRHPWSQQGITTLPHRVTSDEFHKSALGQEFWPSLDGVFQVSQAGVAHHAWRHRAGNESSISPRLRDWCLLRFFFLRAPLSRRRGGSGPILRRDGPGNWEP